VLMSESVVRRVAGRDPDCVRQPVRAIYRPPL